MAGIYLKHGSHSSIKGMGSKYPFTLIDTNWSIPEIVDTSEKRHTRRGGVSWRNAESIAKSLGELL